MRPKSNENLIAGVRPMTKAGYEMSPRDLAIGGLEIGVVTT